MKFYLHTTPSGIQLIEGDKMPVKPVDICGPSEVASCYDRLCHEGRSKTYCFKRYHYEQEIERAKASGIPVKDQERAVSLIAHGKTILDIEKAKAHYCKPGEVYGPFDIGYRLKYDSPCVPKNKCVKPGACGETCEALQLVAILLLESKLQEKEEQELREQIAQILRDNITFSGQVGYYVIHGAIDKLIELFTITRKP